MHRAACAHIHMHVETLLPTAQPPTNITTESEGVAHTKETKHRENGDEKKNTPIERNVEFNNVLGTRKVPERDSSIPASFIFLFYIGHHKRKKDNKEGEGKDGEENEAGHDEDKSIGVEARMSLSYPETENMLIDYFCASSLNFLKHKFMVLFCDSNFNIGNVILS